MAEREQLEREAVAYLEDAAAEAERHGIEAAWGFVSLAEERRDEIAAQEGAEHG